MKIEFSELAVGMKVTVHDLSARTVDEGTVTELQGENWVVCIEKEFDVDGGKFSSKRSYVLKQGVHSVHVHGNLPVIRAAKTREIIGLRRQYERQGITTGFGKFASDMYSLNRWNLLGNVVDFWVDVDNNKIMLTPQKRKAIGEAMIKLYTAAHIIAQLVKQDLKDSKDPENFNAAERWTHHQKSTNA